MKINFKEILNNKNNMKYIIIAAFVGIALIALSEFIPSSTDKVVVVEEEDYVEYLEAKIEKLITAITGESSPVVIITLVSSSEYIYATEKSETINEQEGSTQKESDETYIIIENENGAEQALVIKELEPEINGVVIATLYSENSSVKESIINAVTTVLNLSSNKVSVVNKTK